MSEGSDWVEAGGLMSYATNDADNFRRAAVVRGQDPEGREARRSPCRAADEVRAGDQSENREADRSDDSAVGADAGGQSDQVRR